MRSAKSLVAMGYQQHILQQDTWFPSAATSTIKTAHYLQCAASGVPKYQRPETFNTCSAEAGSWTPPSMVCCVGCRKRTTASCRRALLALLLLSPVSSSWRPSTCCRATTRPACQWPSMKRNLYLPPVEWSRLCPLAKPTPWHALKWLPLDEEDTLDPLSQPCGSPDCAICYRDWTPDTVSVSLNKTRRRMEATEQSLHSLTDADVAVAAGAGLRPPVCWCWKRMFISHNGACAA